MTQKQEKKEIQQKATHSRIWSLSMRFCFSSAFFFCNSA
jgi:hypothetical protein